MSFSRQTSKAPQAPLTSLPFLYLPKTLAPQTLTFPQVRACRAGTGRFLARALSPLPSRGEGGNASHCPWEMEGGTWLSPLPHRSSLLPKAHSATLLPLPKVQMTRTDP